MKKAKEKSLKSKTEKHKHPQDTGVNSSDSINKLNKRKNKKIAGTYYIRARSTGWYLWYKHFEDGLPLREPADAKLFRDLGFRHEWSLDEAKKHCSQINKERSLIREKMRLSAKRVTEIKTINETLFPQERIDEFQNLLEDENFGSKSHLKKLHSHFKFIQKMCNALRILPIEYNESSKRIYKYLLHKPISVGAQTNPLNSLAEGYPNAALAAHYNFN